MDGIPKSPPPLTKAVKRLNLGHNNVSLKLKCPLLDPEDLERDKLALIFTGNLKTAKCREQIRESNR